MEKASQCNMILADLKKGKKVTPLTALIKYKCMRLASRVNDLRAKGHDIETTMVENDNGRKSFAEYTLKE